jgi:hypothetical protein
LYTIRAHFKNQGTVPASLARILAFGYNRQAVSRAWLPGFQQESQEQRC